MPSLLPSAAPDTSPLRARHLNKLVFNNIGFRSLYHLRTLLDLPALQELHLDSNDIKALALYDDDKAGQHAQAAADAAAQDGGRWLCWPHVTTLSLAHNKISSWDMCSAIEMCFPALTHLTLTDNQLPNIVLSTPEDSEVRAGAPASHEDGEVAPTCADHQLRYLQHLTELNVSGNQTITDPCTIDALRVLCPRLEALRLSYEPIFPNWRDALSRMYVVAALPTITILNRGPVRPKERLDSEVFYIQRGLAARERRAPPAGSAAPQEPTYPLLDHLQHVHRDLVLSVYRAGSSASQDGTAHLMLTVQFVCQDHRKRAEGNTRSASIPSSLTVARLKALVKNFFRIDPAHQVLSYRSGDAAVLERPLELDAEQQTLAYYGVPNGARIEVVDNSLQY